MSEKRTVGDWCLEKRIGSGSFSTVWKAAHRRTKQIAAVKEINKEKLNPAFSKCIEAELSFLQKAEHQNIVAFYEKIESVQRLFIVMEYCKDGDLETLMRKGPSDEAFTRQCMIQLTAGFKEMRSMGVVHRDLKPSNLLLAGGVLKIADFGFARDLEPMKLADTLCGSPLYMAPEVLQLKKYDARADLWSVGVIMYEMLVGRTPFEGQTYIDLLKNIETTKVRLPKIMLHNTSSHCLDLMVRLLQRDLNKRIDFDAFFAHPFITGSTISSPSLISHADLQSPQDADQPSCSRWSVVSVSAERSEYGIESPEDEELAYSSDEEFVVIYRRNRRDAHSLEEASGQGKDEVENKEDLDSYLLRVCAAINDLAEARAYGNLLKDAFYLSMINLQILEHLHSKNKADKELEKKMDEVIQRASEFSQSIEDRVRDSQETSNLYGIIFDHALACSKGAAGSELSGRYSTARSLYTKSIDLLMFLKNEGYGLTLANPLVLSGDEKKRIHRLISKTRERKNQCTTNIDV